MAVYTPPEQPYTSADPVADVARAFEWSAEFFEVRAPVIRFIGQAIRARILQVR